MGLNYPAGGLQQWKVAQIWGEGQGCVWGWAGHVNRTKGLLGQTARVGNHLLQLECQS